MYVDDLADACIFLMKNYNESEIINIGAGKDIAIKDIASIIKDAVGYTGEIILDKTKPDGMPRRLLDLTKIKLLGWESKTSLAAGIKKTYEWYTMG